MAEAEFIMHVISGTHWDREWRYTAEQSKVRLLSLLDELIEIMERKPSFRYFILDGGTVVLDDYLSVRPERRDRLVKLIEAGRIHLVSFYTLPDMFIVCGEAVVRNLLYGRRVGAAHGGCMKAGYTATSYGQNLQMPQIYRGFGIDSIIFYRGLTKHQPPCFRWRSPDGSEILTFRCFDFVTRTNWFFTVHQMVVLGKGIRDLEYHYRTEEAPVHLCDPDGYDLEFQLLKENRSFREDPDLIRKAFKACFDMAAAQPIGRHLLGLNMEDNQKPYEFLPELIEKVNEVCGSGFSCRVVQSSFDDLLKAVKEEIPVEELPQWEGELRHTAVEPGFNALLGDVNSSRVNLKILNERTETALIHLAEPLAVLAALQGREYPRLNLEEAWRFLLLNHAHDSICGAAVDQAHEDMLFRFSQARGVAEEVSRRSLEHLAGLIDTKAAGEKDLTLIVFNTLPFPREEIVEAIVDIPEAHGIEYFDIVDAEGVTVPHVLTAREPVRQRMSTELDCNAIEFNAVRHRILFPASIPSFGYRTFFLKKRPPRYVPHPAPGPDRPLVGRETGVLENELFRVIVNANGTFDLEVKETGKTYPGLHLLADNGETGFPHMSKRPVYDFTVTSEGCRAGVTLLETNELRGTVRVDLVLEVPKDADREGLRRSEEKVSIPVTTWITLRKDSPVVELKTRLTNRARDHRLRVLFPTGIKADTVNVEAAFAVVDRQVRWNETGDNMEGHQAACPMQNFLDLSDGAEGIAFLNRGMREYEVMDDSERTVALTLLRTHRAYMVPNSERLSPEEIARYPGLHQYGFTLEFNYALVPHRGSWGEAGILGRAYAFKVPLKIVQGVRMEGGPLPLQASFLTADPADKIIFSGVKPAENGEGWIFRFWNAAWKPVAAELSFGFPVSSVVKCRLDEEESEPLEVSGNRVEAPFRSNEIVTLKVVPRNG